jgi:hypothetical protein
MTWTTGTDFTIGSGWTAGTDFEFLPEYALSPSRDSDRLTGVTVAFTVTLQPGKSRNSDRLAAVAVNHALAKSGLTKDAARLSGITPTLTTTVSGPLRDNERNPGVTVPSVIALTVIGRDSERLASVAPSINEWLFLSGIGRNPDRLAGVTTTQAVSLSVITRDGERLDNVTLEQALALSGLARDSERNKASIAYYLKAVQGTGKACGRLYGVTANITVVYRERVYVLFPDDTAWIMQPENGVSLAFSDDSVTIEQASDQVYVEIF